MFLQSARTFVLVLTAVSLGGCYDLSAPDGPTKSDFARNADETSDPQDEGTATDIDDTTPTGGDSQQGLTLRRTALVLDVDAGVSAASAMRR